MDIITSWLKDLRDNSTNSFFKFISIFLTIFVIQISLLGALSEANLIPLFLQGVNLIDKYLIMFVISFMCPVFLVVKSRTWVLLSIFVAVFIVALIIWNNFNTPHDHGTPPTSTTLNSSTLTTIPSDRTVIVPTCNGTIVHKLNDSSSLIVTYDFSEGQIHDHYFFLASEQSIRFKLVAQHYISYAIYDSISCTKITESTFWGVQENILFGQGRAGNYFIRISGADAPYGLGWKLE
jgi:hypothetical protein